MLLSSFCFVCFCVCECVSVFRLPESVSASLFLCHCVSRLIAGPSGEIDLRNQITKLSNSFIDWLSLLSLSLTPLPSRHPHSLFTSLPFDSSNFFILCPFPPLLPPSPLALFSCLASPPPSRQNRSADVSAGEVWLRRGGQQVCFVVMAMRWRAGLWEWSRRGAVRCR